MEVTKMRYLKPDQAQSKCQLRWTSLFSKSSWIKIIASGLSFELGVNGKKMFMETGILLTKVYIADFTLVNLELLTV